MVMSIAHHWQERSVKWAKPDNLHVTLRFLGDISLERSKSLGRVLDQIACEESPFELALDSVGAFPTVHRPRILWISLSCVDTGLHLLQNRVERATCDLGWEPEIKSYKPHLTLGRVRNKAVPLSQDWIKPVPKKQFSVKEILLMESVLTSAGAEYNVLQRSSLLS